MGYSFCVDVKQVILISETSSLRDCLTEFYECGFNIENCYVSHMFSFVWVRLTFLPVVFYPKYESLTRNRLH